VWVSLSTAASKVRHSSRTFRNNKEGEYSKFGKVCGGAQLIVTE